MVTWSNSCLQTNVNWNHKIACDPPPKKEKYFLQQKSQNVIDKMLPRKKII